MKTQEYNEFEGEQNEEHKVEGDQEDEPVQVVTANSSPVKDELS